MSDLVEHLRGYDQSWAGHINVKQALGEAAARIEALEAENARLREALERAGQSLTKASLCNSEKVDDAKTVISAALAGKEQT